MTKLTIPTADHITRAIIVLRGQRVLLDAEIATLYGVETKVLIQAVKRNAKRFPADFMFELTVPEWVAVTRPTPSQNRAWPCCRPS